MKNSKHNTGEQFCWIDTIDVANTSPELSSMYEQVGATHGQVHNLYRAFSLQPRPLISADQHYRDILHNDSNQSAPWFLELLASQAAIIADCDYALTNHGANFKVLLGDAEKSEIMLQAVREDNFDNDIFTCKESVFLTYAAKLCRSPEKMTQTDIETLRRAGATDTEILEAVQATSCFGYWVRFINALGIQSGNEAVGLFDESGNRRGSDSG